MLDYDFELPQVVRKIKEEKAKTVGLQFPEGLKQDAVRIAKEIEEKTKAKTIIFIGPTYGACDLIKGEDARRLKIDLLIHFGHNQFK